MILNFSDFCRELLDCGFSMGGGNSKGIFALIPYDWNEQEHIETPVKWHTGNTETDPWEWRMRVLEERSDMAYSKLFFKTSGYITQEWYPYFFSVRRKGMYFEDFYDSGEASHIAKIIYDIIKTNGYAALHEIKSIGGFSKEDKSRFNRALTDLQMKMFITVCGRTQKIGKDGNAYGWSSTVFTTVENFWKSRGVKLKRIDETLAYEKIKEQILKLNPDAEARRIKKFILG